MRGFAILLVVGVVLAPTVSFAQSPKIDDARAADMKALQGKWRIVKFTGPEPTSPEELAKNDEHMIVSDNLVKLMSKGKVAGRERLTINPTTNPKEFDFQEVDEKGNVRTKKVAAKKGEKAKEVEVSPSKGIYELKGDRLKLCLGDRNKERPNSFEAKGELFVIELERVK